jgi:dihydroxyacetone kinase-like protein
MRVRSSLAVRWISSSKTVNRQLEGAGVTVARSLVGNYVTSLDMAGCSVTVSIVDEEMKRLWDAPVHAPALRWRM